MSAVAMPHALKQPAVPHGVQVFVEDEPIRGHAKENGMDSRLGRKWLNT
jgi:hypothetical protein